ncbi:MAG: DUF1549 domain-containing protein [Planctomycetota bacterium]|nr:MAG: DUF1549 domain-containing protein [Planctomycetota bacterium]
MPKRRWLVRSVLWVLCAAVVSWTAWAAPAKSRARKPQPKIPDIKSSDDRMAVLERIRGSFPALKTSSNKFSSESLDQAIELYVPRVTKTPFAKVVDDVTFLRRVSLDLTGVSPTIDKIRKFEVDKDSKKRARVIDEFLASDAYARKWARYWRSVVFHDSSAQRNRVNPEAFEEWLFTEFKAGTSWDRIVAEMLSASPQRQKGKKDNENGWEQDTGPNNFVLACENKPELIAAQSARIFMGLSVGCAECHDHPFDDWKREQFHEMAAFFSPGKYYMTDQYDPDKKSEMQAAFLLGEEPPPNLPAGQRRVVVAAYMIYNPDNHWFARAYVNRVWNELLGDGFYAVDSLGPDKEVVHQLIVNRLAYTFRTGGFDTKALYRTICNSATYQRETRTIAEDADLFTAVRPTRLRPFEVADELERVLGADMKPIRKGVERAFEYNPSIPQRDLEGSIQQALLLMNQPQIQNKLARGELKQQLSGIKDNAAMIEAAFLGVLARKPTTDETQRYIKFLKSTGDRNANIDDLLWVLLNSAEFTTRR